MNTWTRNYFWPLLHAILTAVATLIVATLQTGNPLTLQSLGLASLGAAAAWYLTTFNRHAGKDQPFHQPTIPPPLPPLVSRRKKR